MTKPQHQRRRCDTVVAVIEAHDFRGFYLGKKHGFNSVA
jgi:hypothetical protein